MLAPIGAAAGLPSEPSHPFASAERLVNADASAPLLPPGPDPLQPTAPHVALVQPGPHFQMDPPFGATAGTGAPTHFDPVPAAALHASTTGDGISQRPSEPVTGHSEAVPVSTPHTEPVRQHEESHEHSASSSHDSSGTAPMHTDHVGHTDHA